MLRKSSSFMRRGGNNDVIDVDGDLGFGDEMVMGQEADGGHSLSPQLQGHASGRKKHRKHKKHKKHKHYREKHSSSQRGSLRAGDDGDAGSSGGLSLDSPGSDYAEPVARTPVSRTPSRGFNSRPRSSTSVHVHAIPENMRDASGKGFVTPSWANEGSGRQPPPSRSMIVWALAVVVLLLLSAVVVMAVLLAGAAGDCGKSTRAACARRQARGPNTPCAALPRPRWPRRCTAVERHRSWRRSLHRYKPVRGEERLLAPKVCPG